jgi:hypothetical protein
LYLVGEAHVTAFARDPNGRGVANGVQETMMVMLFVMMMMSMKMLMLMTLTGSPLVEKKKTKKTSTALTTTTTQQNHVHATADLLTQEGGQPRENTKTQTKVAPGAQH